MDPTRFKKAVLPGLKASGSPALTYNNLSTGGGRLCFTDSHQVHLIVQESLISGETRISQAGLKDSNVIYESKFVTVRKQVYLVIATDAGVQFWDALGNNILFNFVLPAESPGTSEAHRIRSTFMRAIAVVLTAEETEVICVGSTSGDIFVFEGSGIKFRHVQTLRGHTEAVTSLTSDYGCRLSEDSGAMRRLFSTDDGGRVIAWDAVSPSMFEKSFIIENEQCVPFVAAAVRDNRLVCALSNGTLCFYNLETRTKWLELHAHSRFASALMLHPTEDKLVSAAEDSTLQVLTLPQQGEKIQIIMTTSWPDSMITGATFFGKGHNDIAACAYDTDELRVWAGNAA
uniref:WD repeat-containing protein 54 beta-propeller domain-containing protein n=1 Tax=Pyramimonas obovata TaxID=1411642 RepID=A0A7S0ND86_9CHLO|mmetsp:Transcript_23653/g.51622  ORF Transcript_23653/g.51622 Transcript_23653/m.51622 type:complete len:344 (+) Transcript_23653:221-1252(+)|eukprot:CAMPEP_0118924322 /NCGR_PEP_ID=MMETSP1169-20130426/2507_1 /TAXON_ID=36882 /ORGANISM="Pyramimonas obovata, Strain CCMP722" /LENGTH=343 /DNA_ID=CAMNT_0006865419 /DNA_START=221 /DNA_END=1252 /DNA_ORIENTATION=+